MTDTLHSKHILVIGFARQGKALARWLPTLGAAVTVSDGKNAAALGIDPADFPGVSFRFDDPQTDLPADVDVVCVSGGVPLDIPLIQVALSRGVRVTNDAQLFLERCPAPVIGITGSAGKTTTTTLTGEIVKRAGYTTWIGGNIGDVLLDVLPQIQRDHAVVMELSSFQLELMTASPHVGAILNITPNHLDRHGTMEAYIAAKANMVAYQKAGDIAVLGWDDANARDLDADLTDSVAWFSIRDMVRDGAFLAGQRIVLTGIASPDGNPQVIGERGDIPLRGDHNVLNVLAACAITGAFGVRPEAMMDVIRTFQGVPHRLEVVRVLNGVTYVNDSIATAPERVEAALRSYSEPLVLLLGGKDKDLPWEKVLQLATRKARHIVVFGADGKKQVRTLVAKALDDMGAPSDQYTLVDTLDEAVSAAAQVAEPGDVVLLSPGGTSYDAYVDFAARGVHFRALVHEL